MIWLDELDYRPDRGNVTRREDSPSSQPGATAPSAHADPSHTIWPEIAWLLPLLVIPLWVNFWSFQPFDHAKSLLFSALIWIATGFLVAAQVWQGRPLRVPVFGPLHAGALLWLVVTGFATLWALVPELSLFGSDLRGQGLLTQASYVLFFFLLAWGLRTSEQIDRLFNVVVWGSVPLTALGLLQSAGVDPLGLVSDARSQAHSTLGRANFTGAYLALVLPLTLNRIIAARQQPSLGSLWARMLIFLAAAQVGLLVVTGARSAWIGALAGVVVLGLLRRRPRLGRWRRRTLLGGMGLIAIGGVLGALYSGLRLLTSTSATPASGSWLETLWTFLPESLTAAFAGGSLAARFTIWQATADLIRARPWTGYGLENLEIAFLWVYPPQLVYYQGRDVYVDRSHNLLLDWTAAAGIPGLIGLIFLWSAFFYIVWRAWRKSAACAGAAASSHRLHGTTAAATLVAVGAAAFAANLSGFDVTATALLTWAVMGVAGSKPFAGVPDADVVDGNVNEAETAPSIGSVIGSDADPVGPSRPRRDGRDGVVRAAARVVGGALVLVAALLAVGYAAARPTLAGIVHQSAVQAAERGAWTDAMARAQQAVALWPHSPAHRRLAGQAAQVQARQSTGGEQQAHLRAAEMHYLYVIDRRPQDAAAWAELANFYAAWPEHVDLPAARAAYDQALALAPNLATLWVYVAHMHLNHGDGEGALDALLRAVDLDATHIHAYRLMGDIYGHQYDDWDAANRAYAQAAYWEEATSE